MYADFSYYSDTFGGCLLNADEYNKCANEATDYIDYITAGKAANVTDEAVLNKLKRCCCKMAEAYGQMLKSQNDANIQSESVGSYSVTYRSTADIEASKNIKFREIVSIMLVNTGLMYRGRC